MKIIEELEETKKRCIQWCSRFFPMAILILMLPLGSILYNQENKYISFSVGSNTLSVPEKSMRNAY
jgi:para-aminobenzoate synthetase component 1